jgi:putative tryptophan/tyrosine transport system substrate-binding protein
MRRRDFIALLGGAATWWPLVGLAQQPAMPVIGFLHSGSPEQFVVTAFRRGLNETGYIDGQNAMIEYRWAEGRYDQLPILANELVRLKVAVIAASGTPSTLAAKAATSTIPIVFYLGIDPIQSGLVASLNRPGGNITGIAALSTDLEAKRLEFLHELLPTAAVVALLVNPTNPFSEPETRNVRDAAQTLGLHLEVVQASTGGDIETAFATLVALRAGALVVGADPFFTSRKDQIVALATRHGVPAMFQWREFAVAGGLVSYGPKFADGAYQIGIYAGKILKRAKPADLPVQQAVKLELVINLKTAKALRINVPLSLLTRADELIE